MGIISVRLNKKEDTIMNQLASYYKTDKSALIRQSLMEMYEKMLDLESVEIFEKKESKKKVSFSTADDILNEC